MWGKTGIRLCEKITPYTNIFYRYARKFSVKRNPPTDCTAGFGCHPGSAFRIDVDVDFESIFCAVGNIGVENSGISVIIADIERPVSHLLVV